MGKKWSEKAGNELGRWNTAVDNATKRLDKGADRLSDFLNQEKEIPIMVAAPVVAAHTSVVISAPVSQPASSASAAEVKVVEVKPVNLKYITPTTLDEPETKEDTISQEEVSALGAAAASDEEGKNPTPTAPEQEWCLVADSSDRVNLAGESTEG